MDGPLDRGGVMLLATDVTTTLGASLERVVSRFASHHHEFGVDSETYVQRVVDDVQQYIHDTFVDTTWPACPRHRNHPLWFKDGSWWCEADGVAIVRLGQLVTLRES